MVLKRHFYFIATTALLLCSITAFGQEKTTQKEFSQSVADSLWTKVDNEIENIPAKLVKIFNRGDNFHAEGNILLAADSFREFTNGLRDHFSLMFSIMGDSHKEAYWNLYIDSVTHIQCFALAYSSQYPQLGALAYDCELLIKGLLLESSNRLKFAVLNSGNQEYIDWMNVTEEGRQLYMKMQGYIDLLESDSTYMSAVRIIQEGGDHQLKEEVGKIEKIYSTMNKLAAEIMEFEETMSLLTSLHETSLPNLSVSWIDVHNALWIRQAAIEFVACKISPDSPEVIYYAILIRKGIDTPVVIRLFWEDTISKILQASEFDAYLLFEKVWKPLEQHLNGIQEVFLSTSGLLSGLPFAALRSPHGLYLANYYNIRNLLSTRDVIKLSKETQVNEAISDNVLFFGGADFGVPPGKSAENTLSAEKDIYRGQGFDYLPQSKKEVETSAELLTQMDWKNSVFTDISASKHNLIESVSLTPPSVLHIATHGFYFPKRNDTIFDMKMSDIGSVAKSQYVFSSNPLMRCGLLFSGANYTWNGKELEDGADNGILTGMEISSLNLSKTELAVISACHSAMGDIDYAEGVRGIQRALRIAGVQKTIVALWEIPDKESYEFMREFYTFLCACRNVKVSFQFAQKRMLLKYSAHPEKWAGFILIE